MMGKEKGVDGVEGKELKGEVNGEGGRDKREG